MFDEELSSLMPGLETNRLVLFCLVGKWYEFSKRRGVQLKICWKLRNGRMIFIRGDFQKGANQLIYCSFIISLYNSTGTGLCITSSVIFLALTLQYCGIKPTWNCQITESFLLEYFSTLSSPKRILLLYQSKMDQSLISKYFILQIVKYLISRKG